MPLPVPMQIFIVTLVVGLFLFGAEIFVPGGILGTIGSLALLAAIITGFHAFPGYGGHVALGIIFLMGIAVFLWIRFFPRTRIGRSMIVDKDLQEAKGTEKGLDDLIGKEGKASSDLRPAGFAMIEGKRIDVVSQGGMIEKGTPVQVIEIEGNGVIVKKIG